MGRLVVVVAVALLVVSVAAGEEYLLWYPNPNYMGASVGASSTVEGGHNLYYTVTSTDKDTADRMVDGVKEGGGLYVDATFWVHDQQAGKPIITSCMPYWTVAMTGFDGATGTYSYEFHGVAVEWVEETMLKYDGWWFDDQAEVGPFPDRGSRNDDQIGPLVKGVYVTPDVGWVYGTVKDPWGGGIECQVQLYLNGQPTAYGEYANGDGVYTIHQVPPGNYVARADAMMGGETNATVTKGQGTLANIVVQGGE